MAKTKSELFALIGANLPDNTTGEITPEDLREVTTQIADSMMYPHTAAVTAWGTAPSAMLVISRLEPVPSP